MNLKVSQFPSFVQHSLKPYLQYKADSFIGGQLCHFLPTWKLLTSDCTILQTVQGDTITFLQTPPSTSFLPNNSIASTHRTLMEYELASLISKRVIVESCHEVGEFLSPILSVPKKDNQVRLILNLKSFNQHVVYTHFKMDSIDTVMHLITKDCWMASIDLKDAYYSVKVDESFQKYLKFCYYGKLFQYRAYPNGLSSCPRKFTKLLKPILCDLKIICAYLDDLLLLSTSYEHCCLSVFETIKAFDSLGFVVHPKSAFIPQREIIFLGFNLNSHAMKITLKPDRSRKIISSITKLLDDVAPSIRDTAQVIGYLVSSLPAVKYGKSHYRAIENDKIAALKINKGNFDRKMSLSPSAVQELHWWVKTLPTASNDIEIPPVDKTVNSDASLSGWGAVMGEQSTGGHWNFSETSHHINYLELLAAYFALLSFSECLAHQHVKLLIDNTTAVSVLNNMGTCHSHPCNSIANKIWHFCEVNNIWLTAAHIPGKDNVIADSESRCKNVDTEWMLNSEYLQSAISKIQFSPSVDLFASRLNTKYKHYISYRKDPFAMHIDAFTIPWTDIDFYCFPPFSCILRVIKKVIQDQARGILVLPDWPTQPWYPMLNTILEHPQLS